MVQRPARRGRRPDPRRQGARRPVRERRVRGRQERAGVRRGPDPDARGADQERHDHRRAPLDRARPDRLDRDGRRARDGTESFTIVGSAEARPREGRISNESPVGRALLGKQEGRQGRRQGPGRRLHVQDPQASAESGRGRGESRAMDWADELAASVSGPQVVNDSKTPSGTVHVGSLRGPVILDVISRALRAPGPRDDPPLRRRRPRPDGRPGAPDARRRRARDGPAAGPRPRPGRRLPRLATPAISPADVHRHVRRPRHPARPLLLDERALRDRRDGSVHPDRPRPGRRRSARSTGAWPTSSIPPTGTRSRSSARTAARSARRS